MVTVEELKKLTINENWAEPLNEAFRKFEIIDIQEIAMFISQCAHESKNFTRLEESFNYTPERLLTVFPRRIGTIEIAIKLCDEGKRSIANFVYNGRIGNKSYSNDGYNYRGRGIIQLTGRNNYKTYGDKLGLNLVDVPDMAKEPFSACLIACQYWKDKDCGSYANGGDVRSVTKLINGGYNGLEDRIRRFEEAKEILKV